MGFVGTQCEQCEPTHFGLTNTNGDVIACSECHPECTGCVGAGTTLGVDCIRCTNDVYFNGSGVRECIDNCAVLHAFDRSVTYLRGPATVGREDCGRCHPMCDACSGPQLFDCLRCRHFNNSGVCVQQCPTASTYTDVATQTCISCDGQCAAGSGCSGSGPHACGVCASFNSSTGVCVTRCNASTEVANGMRVCERCATTCEGCTAPADAGRCLQCRTHTEVHHNGTRGDCLPNCSAAMHFETPDSATGGTLCNACHPECATGCTGPLNSGIVVLGASYMGDDLCRSRHFAIDFHRKVALSYILSPIPLKDVLQRCVIPCCVYRLRPSGLLHVQLSQFSV